MTYFSQLIIPPNTPIVEPSVNIIPFTPMIIDKIRILHPTGCVDLVGVWLEYLTHRLYPLNDDGYFLGNGSPIEFNPAKSLFLPPYKLFFKGYNLDTTFIHRITLLIDVTFVDVMNNPTTDAGVVAPGTIEELGELGVI